jgi:preprotein translocase subunit SecF
MELNEKSNNMYQIISKAKYWIGISVALSVITLILWSPWYSLIPIGPNWGLNLGIDFTGGSSLQLSFPQGRPEVTDLATEFTALGYDDARIQTAGESDVVIKLRDISNDEKQLILDQFENKQVVEQSFTTIGPSLGEELKSKAFWALALVLVAIIVFISYAFRGVSNGPVPSWVFGLGAIVALIHDILLVLGVFILLGQFAGVQIDTLFVTALLTILGFSVHDTIVVYDRIRESLKRRGRREFTDIINESINSTLVRSLNTSITTLVVLTVLFFFGGASIQYFVLALIVGIITGTYSSIFIASPLLLFFQKILNR